MKDTNDNYKQICVQLVRVLGAMDGSLPTVANQGQAMDGYSALANFRQLAMDARKALDTDAR